MSTGKRNARKYVRLDEERTVYGKRYFVCRCSCGETKTIPGARLTAKNGTTSCGCYRIERVVAAASTRATHGQSRGYKASKLYHAYDNIRKRCYDPECDMYYRYGGRGILMCERWAGSRVAFFDDMGEPPTPKHSIDRIDNDKGYWCGKPECPECGPANREPNCRWATSAEQCRNKRNNRWIEFNGQTLTMIEWSEATEIPYETIQNRLDALGWSIERTLTQSIRKVK